MRRLYLVAVLLSHGLLTAAKPPIDSNYFAEMRYRLIGPFRGGRTVAVSGVVQQPNIYYMAPVNGGVWKSTDYGNTWNPIFDGQDTGSIGALALAPSDPNIIYVGSGEGLQRPDLSVGDGVYKSMDAGQTWEHLGLRDGQQIASIIVDPHDPNRLFVAVLGHPYGPNTERGVYRSKDGGKSFERVLYKDENTGAVQVGFDPGNTQVIYASLWAARQAPWEIGGSFNGPGSGLFKSTDGGNTWRQLTKGIPTIAQGLGRIGFAIAPNNPKRMYALIDASPAYGGLYRSDDAGESWHKINNEERIWGRGSDFACVQVDPKNEDKIYVANTTTYRSIDAGQTFIGIKGAPGGDDYHTVWINPQNPDIIFLGLDQGATVSVNAGVTWSSWYNQPTAQFYHVITDNRFPYWVYGGQQESGSAGVESRSDDGSISFRNWHPIGVEEYGYVAPDPLNPEIIYGGKATRFNWTTGDVKDVSPQILPGQYRFVRTMPLLFSPVDPHVLYLGSNVLFKTTNGGDKWEAISPDLTRKQWPVPSVIQAFESQDPEKGQHKGVIYTVAPSPKDVNLIWVGTDDGLMQRTRDGGQDWQDVTPPDLTPWSKVSLMEASRFDTETCYAAINRFRLDDLRPHIYRTHDGGRIWKEIVNGLPDRAVVNAVREDPEKQGLLFAGTEVGVFVSFNDGDNWQPLELNLPVTSVRDLVVHENDLVIGTHGRSFWILDDITPLRQVDFNLTSSNTRLFAPEKAIRWRWNRNTDTPLPPEVPVGQNPPDGAIIDYAIQSNSGPAILEIYNAKNQLVRHYSSEDKPEMNEAQLQRELNVPTYWVRPPQVLSAAPGMHRFLWDLRYAPPKPLSHEYPIAAIYKNTPREPRGALVVPGEYTLKLTVSGQSYSQPLTVIMDPRVKASSADLQEQLSLSLRVSGMMSTADQNLSRELLQVFEVIEGSDDAPTSQAKAAVDDLEKRVQALNRQSRTAAK
ncbi:MAG: glycoside hydrolase [Bryobacteraceae bacterium]